MFSDDSILYEMSIISKILGLILVVLGLVLVKMPALIVLGSFTLSVISYRFDYYFRFSIFCFISTIIASFYPQFLVFSKILIFFNYLVLLKKITTATELRYMLEVTLYKFQSKKITFKVLAVIYFFRLLKNNLNNLINLGTEYHIVKNFSFLRFCFKKVFPKTKLELKELMVVNKLRFYNYAKTRTYIEKPIWESWDSAYLLCHILLVLFIWVYGR